MSEPAIFVFVRGGQKRCYGDRWASAFLYRELLWGPDDLQAWVEHMTELEDEDWAEDFDSAVFVDLDQRRLVCCRSDELSVIPRVGSLYERLLKAAWPGFDVQANVGTAEWLEAAGETPDADGNYDESGWRPESLREASEGFGDEDDDYEEEDEDYDEREDEDDEHVRAWITLIDEQGAIRQRQVERLPFDLLRTGPARLSSLESLPAAEAPAEVCTAEGMWIDLPRKTVGVWGGNELRKLVPEIQAGWDGWQVEWAEEGYAAHAAAGGPASIPLTEEQALGRFLPIVLSTKRFDLTTVIGAVGGELKKTALKATGCLLVVICLPQLVFGLITGEWTAVLISVGLTCALVVGIFKYLEYRFRRPFVEAQAAVDAQQPEGPPVAGPQGKAERRERVAALLQAANLPTLDEVEPHFRVDHDLDMLP